VGITSLGTKPSPGSSGNPARRLVADHPGIVRFGKVGWFAKGVVYVIAGVLALAVVEKARGGATTGSTGAQEASPTGALKAVAQTSFGPVLLWLLAIGLVVYSLWRFLSAALPGKSDAESWAKRIGFVVSGIIYLTFAWTAVTLARSTKAAPDGNGKVTDIAASTMSHTAGRFVIGLVGVIVIAVGLYRIKKGVQNDVGDELEFSGMSPGRIATMRLLGRIGELGRGLGIALIGFFLLDAAVTYDAGKATGLDGALRRLAANSWGVLVVAIIGIGFLAYGVFCVATCTHRRLQAP